jgi:hypothetical protein
VNLQLVLATDENISSIQTMADEIWRDHYPEIIGMEQVEYVGAILFKGGNVATDARWTAILSGDVGWSTKGVFGH